MSTEVALYLQIGLKLCLKVMVPFSGTLSP